ncbi:hypothetical protein PVAP13_2NG278709 [Panicum virgatum]|uniref:Uncharacterized protein n=1 Tax=Panicum virgatum TaxID=38727 RepID=A0A8T0VFT6_PANVG|nr:hypothetical protein PVAP13_2NG278709 [Panicum virgatum]
MREQAGRGRARVRPPCAGFLSPSFLLVHSHAHLARPHRESPHMRRRGLADACSSYRRPVGPRATPAAAPVGRRRSIRRRRPPWRTRLACSTHPPLEPHPGQRQGPRRRGRLRGTCRAIGGHWIGTRHHQLN